jgi:hypothetical protein
MLHAAPALPRPRSAPAAPPPRHVDHEVPGGSPGGRAAILMINTDGADVP